MADIGLVLDVELDQQVEIARGRIDLGGELGICELVRHLVGLPEPAFDLHEEGDHSASASAVVAGYPTCGPYRAGPRAGRCLIPNEQNRAGLTRRRSSPALNAGTRGASFPPAISTGCPVDRPPG